MELLETRRYVPPDALLALRIIHIGDHTGLAEVLRKTRNMIATLAIFRIIRARMIEVKFLDILEGHIGKWRQVGIGYVSILDTKGTL
jgi:hypothetical protein